MNSAINAENTEIEVTPLDRAWAYYACLDSAKQALETGNALLSQSWNRHAYSHYDKLVQIVFVRGMINGSDGENRYWSFLMQEGKARAA